MIAAYILLSVATTLILYGVPTTTIYAREHASALHYSILFNTALSVAATYTKTTPTTFLCACAHALALHGCIYCVLPVVSTHTNTSPATFSLRERTPLDRHCIILHHTALSISTTSTTTTPPPTLCTREHAWIMHYILWCGIICDYLY